MIDTTSVSLHQDSSSSVEDSDDDIEAAMQKQLTELKQQKKVGDKFTYLVTGVNQMLFMKASIENHNNLTYKILG